LKPAFELAQVIERFEADFIDQHQPNAYVLRTLGALRQCRTAALGGHVDRCDHCGYVRISYNSCRNRHCPKCQNTQREAWIEQRKNDLLPVPYFHVVFTVPDSLNRFFLEHPKMMYNLLFRTAWHTIEQFAATSMRTRTGMFAVLHTWGQNLSLHPHLHCVIPGGGIDYRSRWKQVKVSQNGKVFLFPVQNLSRVFRGKFIAGLKKQLPVDKQYEKALRKTDWVVYAKEPFAGPQQVVEYLGRYSHKVAISNHRILNINDRGVTFRWRDYRDDKQKVMTLSGAEFLRRFSMHILPKRFVRIRHYGILSSTSRPLLREIQHAFGLEPVIHREKKHWKEVCREHLGFDPDLCPCCEEGLMVVIQYIDPSRAPPAITKNENSFKTNA
jgi:hypothetical protein